uniref:Retrovirus-related Pol polyprotein from transposon TNT 1-94 n=1 Tax=Cajanus cajan TaxID=3821 RepID=A0A151RQ37_CAJCA|nr:Retrovirus-related Pol polyprotein from transposon TNT 1-94 [Cajanus cajan]
MEQPPSFVDPLFPTHVCRLNKALYGLKQAPCAWFQRLSSFLMHSGFICSRADPSLFFFYRGRITLYLLVYVDDIILTGSDPPFLTQFIARLNAEFTIKYLGKLGYFLGLEITYTADGLFLGQAKYAHDLLSRAMMLEAKPISIPLAADFHLVSDGVAYSDPTQYRSFIDLDCHFINELVASGRLAVRHVPTSLQLTDIFTKALPRLLFELFRSKLRVGLNPTLSLTGGVKS